ncbi:MAG TPA: tRNA (adenosine(37)-N6)-dimethylallyltransferase MiaA [Leptospiraceae bacterium]|nr:tRNA (adenosine(37)-N6)-dimethylallyltransferase MiaA [Leptospiraceae bacterium]HMX34911.1 tRNA (adenosine(37)-N6)-dimethylallyltransferase MiaA [Leptospiraceae bacterium]HMY33132.1 tRNA (adenosine(37)-N6)-dimethylallyltransferase MiaA [Leptospiraceae bacterium]HMZ67358.1 tRNA (adenosine(37)-N6)-dimethylallyltransferase MiaA [Leptospiraceae bacterium]HNA10075.1 tRNA (adenosine(37)-N6)-dimethylallyltransferase MiaA [Leptospiraceae bacterium]
MLASPTGGGKTELCRQIDPKRFEVVSFDSRQVYKILSVGTAKPDKDTLSYIPHHLVDFLEPNERITAGFFVKKAEEAIEDIYRRSKIPVITCGTGFYLKAFLYGMYSVPEVDSEIKDKLQKMTREERWELLLAKDKIATESIGFADDYRVMRALEVILSGNIKWSEIKQSKLEGFLDLKKPDVTGMLIYRERQELYDRINQRCKQMIESGILEETKEVVVKYGENAPALNSLGYNFALDYINGKMSMESFLEEFSRSHRNYAKKQITWFKKERVLDTMNWATALEKIKNI